MMEQIQSRISQRSFNLFGFAPLMRAAVMIPLVEKEGKLYVLFEVRAQTLKRQPGEICFPGGKIDETDESEQAAAIRETCEELGLEEKNIQIIESLGILIPPYSSSIYSFVGKIHDYEKITPNQDEVDEVFYVPLDFFLKKEPDVHYIHLAVKPEENFPFELIPQGKEYKWRSTRLPEFFYQYDGKIIWGLTARILYEFISLVK
ncbi:NUDIX hydrolase [Aneurinibacillus aneurinilyticus]|jgi:8-oxo-dGTP pyrophosphatase MutT (NUDIX family)|uniref:CoA pyrophosphatase n=2 Tax=Aneurinibacillus aneurinilyticus TaxID=1391 RepID=A0A848CXU0_ANEAE|nr:CoA pyrophosphatase [Aneurinibacillus aneurinilyticus]ERI08085.1 hydrolase, NUDIX family [Aneurinibacillus aneurinilyticus ATCC 12856]MCI1694390.1 CoA pyrophosphatase [Aneurinibacillus aneurinilyticus]MED0670517.1 CoA pyrophosphatase [Aneurinibacillus aneurinilyticus]MED0706517.1 CoA pyrophosphatase [Aneurinibacillus aneurinilyticus]MED0724418.1 CoA pyrophosphatase [Aneurinibacillus aneurinilyticus]